MGNLFKSIRITPLLLLPTVWMPPAAFASMPGDGISNLYQMEFSQYKRHYTYQVQAHIPNKMSGIWRFPLPGGAGQWKTFLAHLQMLPLSRPCHGTDN